MNHYDITLRVSKELNIPLEVVNLAYSSYYKFMRETIKELPLRDNLDEEEFSKLKTNFNLPSLGKLHCNYQRMVGVNKLINRNRNV